MSRRVVLLTVSSLALLGGCSSAQVPTERVEGAASTVVVERRDITPVLTVDGIVGTLDRAFLSGSVHGPVHREKLYDKTKTSALRGGTTVGYVADKPLRVPTAALEGKWLVPQGAVVGRGLPVFSFRPAVLTVMAEIPGTVAFAALTSLPKAKAQIIGGPAPFECSLLEVAGARPSGDGGVTAQTDAGSASVHIACGIPASVPAVSGAPAVLALRTSTRKAAVAVPMTSVAGRVDQGEVTVVGAHGSQQVRIHLGATDGSYVEVLEGLEAGNIIAADAPNIRLVAP